MSRVEGLLLQAQRKLREQNHAEAMCLMREVYTLLPLRVHGSLTAHSLSDNLDVCQVTHNTC